MGVTQVLDKDPEPPFDSDPNDALFTLPTYVGSDGEEDLDFCEAEFPRESRSSPLLDEDEELLLPRTLDDSDDPPSSLASAAAVYAYHVAVIDRLAREGFRL
jgi:hypothetical protein